MLSDVVLNHKFHLLEKGKSIEDLASEEAVEAFRKTVDLRNQMGGVLYFSILNEECHMLYDVCRHKDTDEDIMQELLKDLA